MKTELIEKLEKLPASLQKEVEGYVDFLIFKDQHQEKADPSLSFTYNNKEENQSLNTVNEPGVEKTKSKRESGKLKDKIWMSDDFDGPLDEKPKLQREFGGLKGLVTYIADDFDAPLEDFKDYM